MKPLREDDTLMSNNVVYKDVDWGMQWCSWLRHCATSQKVGGSIPDGVSGIFY
jgi:hypothetical protein